MPGTTPTFGWPYPEPGDKIATGADIIGQFITGLEDQEVLPNKPVSDAPSTYPLGTSFMRAAGSSAVGWPQGADSCCVVTHRMTNQVMQYWHRFRIGTDSVAYRLGNADSDQWGPWRTVTGDGTPDAQASGQITIASKKDVAVSGTVRFPPGRFSRVPRVVVGLNATIHPAAASASCNNITTSGMQIWVARSDDIGQSVSWLAVQGVDI